jgi:3-phenylpropionate/cinnamic acid dioxygenase small subunit
MRTSDDRRLERLEAIADVRDTLYRIARCVDRRDWTGLQKLVGEGCFFDYGVYRGGFSGLAEWLSAQHEHIIRSSHLIGNVIVEFSESGVALVESYVTSSQRRIDPDDGGAIFDVNTFARYVDRFERENQRWRIKKRMLVVDNTRRHPVAPEVAGAQSGLPMGRRDAEDILWKERAAVGIRADDADG